MAANPIQYLSVLKQKLQPSIDIQTRGSVSIPLKNSTLFGPQINAATFGGTGKTHRVTPLEKQLGKMNQ